MAGKKITELFTREDIHRIGSGLGYGTLTHQAAEDLVSELLSKMSEMSEELVDVKMSYPMKFKEIIENPRKYRSFVVSELRDAFKAEYADAAEREKGYI